MKRGLSFDIPVIAYLLTLQCRAFIVREVIVNEPVTLPCTCSGKCPAAQWTHFIPSEGVIAESRTCHSEHHCKKRFALGDTSRGNYSLMISSVAYTDAGSYRCSCDGESVTEVKLKVLVPTVIKAFKGQNVTLPCYGDTRHDVKDVKWKKDGQKVLLYTHANRSVTTDEASESRFMMSVENFLGGDLSLHISSVHLSDAGLYQCLLHDESQDGEPRAVLLTVEGLQQLSTTNSSKVSILCALLGFSISVIIGLIIYIQINLHT